MNPLSAIYSAGVYCRNRLYDSGVLNAKRLRRAVISVGSLSAGGAGKTPFVILLGQLLGQRGITFDVLSRGYRRESRGVRIVDPSGTAKQFGDEPLLIARRLECPVVVGESRYEAGAIAEKEFQSQLHILDDGFQHRELARDFDIVLLTQKDLTDVPLPIGRLREPHSSLTRADAIVIPETLNYAAPVGKLLWRIRRNLELVNVPERAVVFCGIARPQEFIQQLKAKGTVPVAQRFFRDHHPYSDADIELLLKLRENTGGTGFITTEKDAINLGGGVKKLGQVALAKVSIDLLDSADALDTMLRVIAGRKPSP